MKMKLLLFHSSSEPRDESDGATANGRGDAVMKTDDWWMIFATAAIRRVRGGG